MKIGIYSVIFLVCICGALFSGQTMARTGRKEGTVKIAVSRSRKDALEFIQRENQLAGELLIQGYETEDDAHLAASQRYLDSSLKTQREVSWRVYKRDNLFFFTYPQLGEHKSKFVSLPKKLQIEGTEFISAGHTHYDNNYNFSGQDWRLVTQEKRRGHGIKLYLANARGELKSLCPKMARKRWSHSMRDMLAKSWTGTHIASVSQS